MENIDNAQSNDVESWNVNSAGLKMKSATNSNMFVPMNVMKMANSSWDNVIGQDTKLRKQGTTP